MPSVTDDPTALPQLLRRAAADVIIDKGLGSFSLREVARRAGVSHAAPGYHFGDTRGLLTSLAAEGLAQLRDELEAAAATTDDPIDKLTAIGRAYVRVGKTHPAHCEVIFRHDLIDPDDQALDEAGLGAVAVLAGVIEEIAATHNPGLAVDDAVKLCWCAMQGLVQIEANLAKLDEQLGHQPIDTETTVARFTTLMIEGLINIEQDPGPTTR